MAYISNRSHRGLRLNYSGVKGGGALGMMINAGETGRRKGAGGAGPRGTRAAGRNAVYPEEDSWLTSKFMGPIGARTRSTRGSVSSNWGWITITSTSSRIQPPSIG